MDKDKMPCPWEYQCIADPVHLGCPCWELTSAIYEALDEEQEGWPLYRAERMWAEERKMKLWDVPTGATWELASRLVRGEIEQT